MECNKVKFQARLEEMEEPEPVRIYHHDLHQRHIKKSAILRLQTKQGMLEGHTECANFLEQSVADILIHPVFLDQHSQSTLLNEVDTVFTNKDNDSLNKPVTKQEVKDTISAANHHAAPGTDGITSYFYNQHFDFRA